MISYFLDNKLIVTCSECKKNGINCKYPEIAKSKKKEDPFCNQGEPNNQLNIEIKKMEYHIQRSKINENNKLYRSCK